MAFDMALQMKPPNTSFLPQRQSSLTIFSRNRRHLLNQPTPKNLHYMNVKKNPNNKHTVPPLSNEMSNDVSPYGSIRGWIRQIDGMNKRDYRINPRRADNVTSYASNRRLMNMRGPDGKLPSKLRKIECRLIDCITNEIMDIDPNVRWDDIAGLHHAKKCVTEMVIWPWLRPDVFKGCLSPGRGLLLFGPPGTGKTMIGKAIAGEANATFFYISTSSLTGKYVGDDEKLVRALFGVASSCQPAVIFVDEIDILLSKRSDDYESECSRGLKTQFLIEMDGLGSGNDQILIIGATNRPQDLDEAARRRFTKHLYIPLPSSVWSLYLTDLFVRTTSPNGLKLEHILRTSSKEARASIILNLLENDGLSKLSTQDIDSICKLTEGYSGTDMNNLVKEAAMGPMREAMKQCTDFTKFKKEDMRAITLKDFEDALQEVRCSVSLKELDTYEDWNNQFGSLSSSKTSDQPSSGSCSNMLRGSDGELSQKLNNIPPHLIENIYNEIIDHDTNVRLDDIAGLHHAKKCVTEMAILPLLRPDIFKGCRSPGRGLLLFGPPGTGKTMIGKAIAGEAKATFFYVSASSLTSKWLGESEKLVRALFGVASCRQPAVIFVDEIESMLSQRQDGEHECDRKMKTQFFIEMEGFESGNDQILLIGATNRPQNLDDAARRRLAKRLYIPLPSAEARSWIVRNLLEKDGLFTLSEEDVDNICRLTEGYSGSDMKNLVKEASMGPLREALKQWPEIAELKNEDMRPVTLQDFKDALQEIRPSVSLDQLGAYEDWNNQFGSLSSLSM